MYRGDLAAAHRAGLGTLICTKCTPIKLPWLIDRLLPAGPYRAAGSPCSLDSSPDEIPCAGKLVPSTAISICNHLFAEPDRLVSSGEGRRWPLCNLLGMPFKAWRVVTDGICELKRHFALYNRVSDWFSADRVLSDAQFPSPLDGGGVVLS